MSTGKRQSDPKKQALTSIKSMFGEFDEAILISVLQNTGYNINRAIDTLLEMQNSPTNTPEKPDKNKDAEDEEGSSLQVPITPERSKEPIEENKEEQDPVRTSPDPQVSREEQYRLDEREEREKKLSREKESRTGARGEMVDRHEILDSKPRSQSVNIKSSSSESKPKQTMSQKWQAFKSKHFASKTKSKESDPMVGESGVKQSAPAEHIPHTSLPQQKGEENSRMEIITFDFPLEVKQEEIIPHFGLFTLYPNTLTVRTYDSKIDAEEVKHEGIKGLERARSEEGGGSIFVIDDDEAAGGNGEIVDLEDQDGKDQDEDAKLFKHSP